MHYFPAKEVIPGVWIGSQGDCTSEQFMREHQIGVIINCTKDVPAPFKDRIPTYRIPLDDAEHSNPELIRHMEYVAAVIDVCKRDGKNVLVHCYAGVSRSASTVAAYLILATGMSKEEAIATIRAKKKETFHPRLVFDTALTIAAQHAR